MTNTTNNFIVIDDDPVDNMICVKIIKNAFPEAYVYSFTNPDFAFNYITSNYDNNTAPDTMVFLDINMPVLNGWEFLEVFERFNNRIKAHINIYMLTSSFNPDDKQRAAKNENVSGYFQKPFSEEKLESLLNVTSEVH